MNVPDNYDLWGHHEAMQAAWLLSRPICSYCGRRIQDERLFDINGETYHLDCAEKEFCKYTEDYEE